LAEPAEQLVDVYVLRTVDGGELQQNELEVGRAAARRSRSVIDQHAVGEEAAQHRLKLVMVGIDEAGHDDAAGRVDLRGTTRVQVAPAGADLFAPDHPAGLRKAANRGLQRQERTAANDIAPARPPAVERRISTVCRGGARPE